MELTEKLERLPDRPGVYLYKDAKGQVVYVGKAASVRTRVRSYFQASRTRDAKTDALVDHIADVDYIVTANELEALILESNLVKRHRPRYNIILRDDKHYPFLKLTTNEEYPRLLVARRVQKDGATYYGPFYPATALRETLRLVRALFPLRTCSIKIDGSAERPVPPVLHPPLPRALHRLGDAGGLRADGRDVQAFLEGRDEDLARRLDAEMEEAAAQEKYERAGILRDQVQALNTSASARRSSRSSRRTRTSSAWRGRAPRRASSSSSCGGAGCSAARPSSWTSWAARRTGSSSRRCSASSTRRASSRPARSSCRPRSPRRRSSGSGWRSCATGASSSSCPSAGGSASWSRWRRRTPRSPSRPTSSPASSRRQVVAEELRAGARPARRRPTASRASTSRTSRGRRRSARWSSGRPATMKKDDYKRFKIRTVPAPTTSR